MSPTAKRADNVDTPAPPASPRHALLWAALTYALCTLALAYPMLTGQFLVNARSDQYIAGYAFREFAATYLRDTGSFPLWNPYLFGGMPYVAAMHGDIFYPTFLLRLIMPTDVAMSLGFAIHLFLAGLFTYLFLRALGLGFFASLIGGVAYMLGGNVAGLVSPGHDGKLFISALLPLTLLFVLRLVRDGRPWAWGALAFTVGMAVLTPHPQLLQYLLLTAGFFGLFLAFADTGEGKLPRAAAMRRLGLAALAVIVGGLIGAIQFNPLREYVDWSPRAGGTGWEHVTSFSLPLEEMLSFVLPQFSGILDRYWGRNGIHFHSEYIGAALFLLMGLAFARSASAGRKRTVWFFTGVFVISLLWALGGHTPFYRIVYALVPGTKFFRAPSTMLFVVSFSVSVLAAIGAERALRGEVTRRYLTVWLLVIGAFTMLGIAGGLTNLGMAVALPGREDLVADNAGALRTGAFRMFVFFALTVAVIYLASQRRLSRDMQGALLTAVIAIDLWSVARLYWQFSPPAQVLYASDATIEYLKKQEQPIRVLPVFQDKAGANFRDPVLRYDGLMTHRVRNVLGYHGNELGRYQLLGGGSPGWQQTANPNFWRLMNVQFLLINEDSLGIPELQKVVGPVKNAAGNNVTLYQMREQHPFAWVAPVIVKAPDDAVLATVLDPRYDVRSVALFDTSAAVQGVTVQQPPPPLALPVRTLAYEPGRISVELSEPAPAGSALIVSENFYPGWSATIDGREATPARANMTLIGVPLPQGARKVDLAFSSAPYETGKAITIGALLLSVLGLGLGLTAFRHRSV